jgi:hypothetical protein
VIDPFNGTADIDRLNNEMDLENKDVETIPGK